MTLKTVLICKMHKNDIIAWTFCKTIEMIKCDVFIKYEPSTKTTRLGIKENKFMMSSLQCPLKLNWKNTDQLIKPTVINF